jgi:hypothetical protein
MRIPILFVSAAALLLAGMPAAESQSLTGTFRDSRGGRTNVMTITQGPGGTYRVNIEIAARRCMGSIDARGRLTGRTLIATATNGGETCTLTIEPAGSGLSVRENQCLYFHGASCEFDGIYQLGSR